MEQCDATIANIEFLTPEIARLTLHAPSVAACAKPGQFVNLKVGNGFDPLLRRPFSIHRILGADTLQVVFKIIGKGTSALANLHCGQSVSLVGPLGNHFEFGAAAMCLVGGGLGIAPLVYLAQAILERKPAIRLKVILGARTRDELACFSEEFHAMGIETHLATDDGSLGHHGLVSDLLPVTLGEDEAWQVCCCGPHLMMKSVAGICRQHGWPCQVSLETMMACGISACLGCAVEASPTNSKAKIGQYFHVCQDGPIFFEGDIKWNR